MTAPRIVVRGATTATTRRTTMRKAFLGPWSPLVGPCWLYAMADAQRQTEVAVHHTVVMPTHHHTSVTGSRANVPTFFQRLHREMSCAVNALMCAKRYDAPREVFDDRSTHMMRLMDEGAQMSHLVYEHLNAVAAGLVDRPEDMPGWTFDFALWKTGHIEVERPPAYFGADRPERLRLQLTPPPLLLRAFGGDIDKLIYGMQRLVRDGLRAIRAARSRPVLGADALRRIHPWSEPRTLREPGGARVPTFKFGARGVVLREERQRVRELRVAACEEVTAFRREHETARLARRAGDFQKRYPFGSYAARVLHNVPTEQAPPPGALVAQPGPLLSEVRAELERQGSGQADPPHPLLDEVRGVFRDEASHIVEDAELDRPELRASHVPDLVASPSADTIKGPQRGEAERPAPFIRHRFDKQPSPEPRRVITLRDRRGGGRHGSDPPA